MWSRAVQDRYLDGFGCRLELDVDRSPYRGRLVSVEGQPIGDVDGLMLEDVYDAALRLARGRRD